MQFGCSLREAAMNVQPEEVCKTLIKEARVGPQVSRWYALDQKRIDAFADITEDHQFIHLDPDRTRRETPFPDTIAHGFLTLSMASRFYYDAVSEPEGMTLSLNYGFDRVRFLSPVVSGKRIRGKFELQSAVPRGDTGVMTDHALTIEIEDEERPAVAARWLTLLDFG